MDDVDVFDGVPVTQWFDARRVSPSRSGVYQVALGARCAPRRDSFDEWAYYDTNKERWRCSGSSMTTAAYMGKHECESGWGLERMWRGLTEKL